MSLRSSIGRWRRIRERQRYHDPFCYGRDFIEEISKRLPHLPMRIIFDVGAWNGVTAMQFSDAFPYARVFAFEPVDENFRKIRNSNRQAGDYSTSISPWGKTLARTHSY
jgi:hypothetical protein